MSAFSFLNRASGTQRALRSSNGKYQGDETKRDVSAVLTAAQGGVTEFLFENFTIRLSPKNQRAIRDIVAEHLDPEAAVNIQEKARRQQRAAEMSEAIRAAMSEFTLNSPAPAGQNLDIAAIMAENARQNQAMMTQMMTNMMTLVGPLLANARPAETNANVTPPVQPTAIPTIQVTPALQTPAEDEVVIVPDGM